MASVTFQKFKNREQAAERLAMRLQHLVGENPLILAIPRGAVAMGDIIAKELGGELELLLVHKIGHPRHPEYAIGSVDEFGDFIVTDQESADSISQQDFASLVADEVRELQTKRQLYTPYRRPIDVRSRVCVVVDDGIATGSTLRSAIRTLKKRGAGRIIVAAPVASYQAIQLLRGEGVELAVLEVPSNFFSVSLHFEDFTQVTDEEVIALLRNDEISIEVNGITLNGSLHNPDNSRGLVIFAHGSGSSRHSPRNQFVANELNRAGFATLLLDLLTDDEAVDRENVFDIDLLSERLVAAANWARSSKELKHLSIIFFGASTGAGAALKASVRVSVAGVISRGGRVDLAEDDLPKVKAPVLLIVGSLDSLVLEMNQESIRQMINSVAELEVVENASHLFEEKGALNEVAARSVRWLNKVFTSESSRKKEGVINDSGII